MLSKKITRETKIILIGWAGKSHFELDKGITHYTCVWNGVFMDGEESTFPISVDNISNAYYGLDLTRLKVYYLQDFQAKKIVKQRRLQLLVVVEGVFVIVVTLIIVEIRLMII
jgi:hypothetical protein